MKSNSTVLWLHALLCIAAFGCNNRADKSPSTNAFSTNRNIVTNAFSTNRNVTKDEVHAIAMNELIRLKIENPTIQSVDFIGDRWFVATRLREPIRFGDGLFVAISTNGNVMYTVGGK